MTRPLCKILGGIALAVCAGNAAAQDANRLDCVIEPRTIVDLTPTDEGMLRKILVARGDAVTEGMPLAQLDSEIEALQLELARIKSESDAKMRSQEARTALRRVELERVEGLRRKNIASGTQLEEAQIELTLSELALEDAKNERKLAAVERAQAEARLVRRTLRSPVDGVVIAVDGAAGEYAHEQSVVMRIAEIDPLHVEVFAPAELYGKIAVGQHFDVIPVEPIGGRFSAVVSVVDPVFDAASGTFGVRLHLPNPNGNIPAGVRCSIEMPSG